jgi:hypothetical protein
MLNFGNFSCEMKYGIVMAKAALNKKRVLFANKMD